MNTVNASLRPERGENAPESPERILTRLDWQVIRRLDGLLQGDYRTLFYGSGLDFADLREYQAGDDIRKIDWNVSARMNTPYVRQYLEDREITAWFLLDLSPSMAFGVQERSKGAALTDFVATLARLLTRSGNRIGAVFYNQGIERTIPAGSGRNQVLRLISNLSRHPSRQGSEMTDMIPLLESALNTIKKRSLIFLISDFICKPGWERPIRNLKRRHDLLPVRLWDPLEMELPDVGMILIEDSETGEQLYVDTHDNKFRQQFTLAAQKRAANLNQVFKEAGLQALSLSTQDDLVRAILRFVQMRKKSRQQHR